MTNEIYGGSWSKKKRSSSELKRVIKTMKASYKKWDQIRELSQEQQRFDEQLANEILEQQLQQADEKL